MNDEYLNKLATVCDYIENIEFGLGDLLVA